MIVSAGYEGWTPDDLAAALADRGVTLVVDVRLNAVSRKRGFSKRGLGETLAGAGIAYRHEPTLGNPPDNREAFKRGEDAARARMRAILDESEGVDRLAADVAGDEVVALLCVERDAPICHRTLVVDVVRERMPAVEVVEVQPP
jgi:uncharacterized protein (DUF488 family)